MTMSKSVRAVTVHSAAPTAATRWVSPREIRPLPPSGRPPSRRSRRGADAVWPLAEIVLASRQLSSLIVVAVTLVVATLYVRAGGIDELIANLSGLAVAWGAAYGLVGLGRRWRGVRPPVHVPGRPSLRAIRWHSR
jgi:hypothetical protein